MTRCAKIIVGFMENVGNGFFIKRLQTLFIFSTFFTFFNVFFNFHLNVYYIRDAHVTLVTQVTQFTRVFRVYSTRNLHVNVFLEPGRQRS